MDSLNRIQDELTNSVADAKKFVGEHQVHAASTRVRKSLKAIMDIAKDARKTVTDIRNDRDDRKA